MARRSEAYRMVDGRTPLAAAYFNGVFEDLDIRLADLEALRLNWQEAVAEVSSLGLLRIDELIGKPVGEVNAAIAEVQRRLADLPDLVTSTAMQAALQQEAAAREALGRQLAYLDQLVATGIFPSMEGKAGQFLSNDGTHRVWAAPKVTGMDRGTAAARQLLGINADGDISGIAPLERLARSERATLRALAGGTAVVAGLGLFAWDATVGAADVDDDETLFVATSGAGCWRMVALDAEATLGLVLAHAADTAARFITTDFYLPLTTLAATAQYDTTLEVTGVSQGDHVIATPTTVLGVTAADNARLVIESIAPADNTVLVSLRNSSAAAAALTPTTWNVLIIRKP